MAQRPSLPTKVETIVTTKSHRRCALCFGLDKDANEKRGQIAHINRKNDDNREGNLAFLCLNHHDLYDSQSRHTKGYQPNDLKHYRDALYKYLEELPINDETSKNQPTFSALDEKLLIQFKRLGAVDNWVNWTRTIPWRHEIDADMFDQLKELRDFLTSQNSHIIESNLWDKISEFNLCLRDFIKIFEHLSSIENNFDNELFFILPKYNENSKTYVIPPFHKSKGRNPEHYEKYKYVYYISLNLIDKQIYELTRLANEVINAASKLGLSSHFPQMASIYFGDDLYSPEASNSPYIGFQKIVNWAKKQYFEFDQYGIDFPEDFTESDLEEKIKNAGKNFAFLRKQ